MDLEISWTANWIGNYNVCYRELGTSTYTCSTEFVGSLGLATKTITVPNNFCDEITYEGYILAECQGGSDPAEGTQFVIQIAEKVDPCISYNIRCDNAPINLIFPNAPGSGYVVGEVITADGIPVGNINLVAAGAISSVVLTDNTTTFTALPVMAINTAGGVGGVIGVELANCSPTLDGCDGSNDQGVPAASVQVKIPVNSNFFICASSVPAPLPAAQMTVTPSGSTDTCHCERCIIGEVSNPTANSLSIWYMTYDPGLGAIVLWKEVIVAGASNQPLSNSAVVGSINAEPGLVVVESNCPAIS